MTSDPGDADLREALHALRHRDEAEVPAFESLWTRALTQAGRARRIPAPARAWAAGGSLAAVALGFWLILSPQPTPPDLAPVALPGWRMPTDSLLAGSGDPLQRLSWATLPTDELGRSSFNRSGENR